MNEGPEKSHFPTPDFERADTVREQFRDILPTQEYVDASNERMKAGVFGLMIRLTQLDGTKFFLHVSSIHEIYYSTTDPEQAAISVMAVNESDDGTRLVQEGVDEVLYMVMLAHTPMSY